MPVLPALGCTGRRTSSSRSLTLPCCYIRGKEEKEKRRQAGRERGKGWIRPRWTSYSRKLPSGKGERPGGLGTAARVRLQGQEGGTECSRIWQADPWCLVSPQGEKASMWVHGRSSVIICWMNKWLVWEKGKTRFCLLKKTQHLDRDARNRNPQSTRYFPQPLKVVLPAVQF